MTKKQLPTGRLGTAVTRVVQDRLSVFPTNGAQARNVFEIRYQETIDPETNRTIGG